MSSAGAPIRGLEQITRVSDALATFGPALAHVEEQSRSLAALGAAVAQTVSVSDKLEAHLGFAPLATKLAELSAAIDRIQPKRRRAVCKLGRGAANRSHALAALDRLSLNALEQVLDTFLDGEWPEELEPARERLSAYRSAIRQQTRLDRAEGTRREARIRAGTRTRSDRKPREARTHSRPVGSLAPPRASHSQLSTHLPRGRPPM